MYPKSHFFATARAILRHELRLFAAIKRCLSYNSQVQVAIF